MSLRFRLVGRGNPDFLDLPWDEPLDQWHHERLRRMAHGVSRHVVRFVEYDSRVFALKETQREPAEREYRLLRRLGEERLPAVEAVGVVTEREGDLPSVLITRYLDFALPFRYLFGARGGPNIEDNLVDALVVLLVRLHLAGFFWGDCSLSNTLFRRDAGALAAYLVDAETGDLLPELTEGQRGHDLDITVVNIGGELYDLQAAGRLPRHVDPADTAAAVEARYHGLWAELTAEEVVSSHERHKLDQRIRRLNDLGFDIDEFELVSTADGHELRLRPQVVEAGHHQRRLERLTGLAVQENQARRLLNDLDSYRGCLERDAGEPVAGAVAAYRWLTELFEPTIAAIPVALRGDLEPPELFHEVLEHRWFLSEAAGREVDTTDAVASYVTTVLAPAPLATVDVVLRAFPVVYASGVDATASFYERLGFVRDFQLPPDGEPGYVGMHRDAAEVAVVDRAWPVDQHGIEPGTASFEMFVYVDDADAAIDALAAAGVTVLRPPADMPWGERVGFVADPDGNPVAIATAPS